VGGIANVASATQGSIRLADGSRRRYVRVGAADHQQAFVCRDTGDLQQDPGPRPRPVPGMPCVVQGPWTFQGESRSYPHVERDLP
jgi:hypothetical protein